MEYNEIKVLVIKLVQDGKLLCSDAFELHEVSGIPIQTIGEIANELNIKISACQLGCFK